jgi:hypothetical protein
MTAPNDGTTPDQPAFDGSGSEPTRQLPQEPTQSIPGQYNYPSDAQTAPSAPTGAGIPDPVAGANDPTGPGVPFSDAAAVDAPRKRTGLVVGGIAAVVLLGGAAAFGVSKLSGGGAQPADVLPGDAYAYFRLDIDPSAGQKIAAVRFLDKLPQVKDALGGDDPRKKLWEQISADDECASKIDYDNTIAPWLGDRVGVALRPGGTEETPNVAVALQVSDEAKATETAGRLLDCGGKDETDVQTKDGYLLITAKGQGAGTLAAIEKGTLAQNSTFSGDMAALGEQGVLSMWADLPSLTKEVNSVMGMTASGLLTGRAAPASQDAKGRVAAALRFDPSFIELAGVTRGVDGVTKVAANGDELAALPEDTLGALQISGADQMLDSAWPQLSKQLDELAAEEGMDNPLPMIEQELGIKLPDDLKVLLGKSFTLAVPDQDFSSDLPSLGAKVTGTDAARAEEIITSIEDAAGSPFTLLKKADGDRFYLSTTQAYADQLAQRGTLGDTETFKAAVGDTGNTNVAFFLNLDRLEKLYLAEVPEKERAFVEALSAFGLNASTTGDGEGRFAFRLVGN